MIPGKYPVISTVLRMQIFFLKTSYEYREKIRLKRKEKHYSGKEKQKIGLRVGKWQMYLPGAGKNADV